MGRPNSSKPKRTTLVRRLPEVFKETEGDTIERDNSVISGLVPRGQGLVSPTLPSFYDELDLESKKVAPKASIYAKLAQFSPYLIKKLLYLSATDRVTAGVQLKATQTLVNKIMPNLEASQVQVNHDVQSLVIVKSTNKDPK